MIRGLRALAHKQLDAVMEEIARLSFIAGRRSGIKEIMPHTSVYKKIAKRNAKKAKKES